MKKERPKNVSQWAVVVVQLEEQTLQTLEGRGSNPIIGHYSLLPTIRQSKDKKATNGPV